MESRTVSLSIRAATRGSCCVYMNYTCSGQRRDWILPHLYWTPFENALQGTNMKKNCSKCKGFHDPPLVNIVIFVWTNCVQRVLRNIVLLGRFYSHHRIRGPDLTYCRWCRRPGWVIGCGQGGLQIFPIMLRFA